MEHSRDGLSKQLENEASSDPLLRSIAEMKQLQAHLKEKETLEKRKREDEKNKKSREQLAAQRREHREEQRIRFRNLNDPSVPRLAALPRPATSLPRPATSPPRPATFLPRPATSLSLFATSLPRFVTSPPRRDTSLPRPTTSPPRPTTSVPRSTTSVPQPQTATPTPFQHLRNHSPVELPLQECGVFLLTRPLVTRPVVTPPRDSRLDFSAERDRLLSMKLFGSNESDSDTVEHHDISEDSDYSDSDMDAKKKCAKKKCAKKKPNAKTKTKAPKAKPSGTEYCTEAKIFTCKICCQVFTSKRGFNIHKTRIHNETIAKDHGVEEASGIGKTRKGPGKKKPSTSQRKVNVNITLNNTVNHNWA